MDYSLTRSGHGELSLEKLPSVTNNRRGAPKTESRHPSKKNNELLNIVSIETYSNCVT